MKKGKTRPTPNKGKLTICARLCNHLPGHGVAKQVREAGVETMVRTFSAWSRLVALLYAQLTHVIGLNDVCDALRHYLGWLARIRGATPPSRNGLSHARRHRDAFLPKMLFWQVLAHLRSLRPTFGTGRRFRGLSIRLKPIIHVVDFTTTHPRRRLR